MKLLYFAWLREKIGLSEETVDAPTNVRDVADLLGWLSRRGPSYAEALSNRRAIRVAVNQVHAGLSTPVADGDEVALFPPVTGGTA